MFRAKFGLNNHSKYDINFFTDSMLTSLWIIQSTPGVDQNTTWLTASWFIGKLSSYRHDYPKHCKPQTLLSNRLRTSMNTADCVIRSMCNCNWVQLMQIIFCRDMCIFLFHKNNLEATDGQTVYRVLLVVDVACFRKSFVFDCLKHCNICYR